MTQKFDGENTYEKFLPLYASYKLKILYPIYS